MRPELRLLTGQITDDEYRAYVAMGRLPIARPGWSNRLYQVAVGIGALVTFVFMVAALLSLGALGVAFGLGPVR